MFLFLHIAVLSFISIQPAGQDFAHFPHPTHTVSSTTAQHDRLQKERDQLQERMNHLEEQREHLQMQTDQAFRSADEIEKIYDEIWNHANTIHLYSSLAEEESKSITMKEKQKEIIRTTEEILNIIYKYKGNV